MLSMQEQTEFVLSHPYRVWSLLKIPATYIGSVYLLRGKQYLVFLSMAL
ncbi:hypothetical protein ABH945_003907 [Paraburkholderia sp. GAS333]